MKATISLQSITTVSGYFNINIKVVNTSGTSLTGMRLRPIYITLPDGTTLTDAPFGTSTNPSYDPFVVASWTLPTIAAGATFVQTSLLPVASAIYQRSLPHICQFFVVQEAVALQSSALLISITPLSDYGDPIVSSLHNNTDVLSYQATISSTGYANAFTSALDSANLGTTATLQLVSASTSDTQMYRILGLDGSGNVLSERGLLTGTTVLNSRSTFSYLYDVSLSSPANGNVTVSQASTLYLTVPATCKRAPGFRFADNRPRLIHSLELGCDTSTISFMKLTTTGFKPTSIETPIFENTFSGSTSVVYLYPPIYIAPNTIVRGYSKLAASGSANLYGALTTDSVLGF